MINSILLYPGNTYINSVKALFFLMLASLLPLALSAEKNEEFVRDVRSFEEHSEGERDGFLALYGDAAEPAVELINAIQKSKGGEQDQMDRKLMQKSLDKLEKLDTRRMKKEERSKVAKAWWKAAELTRRMDGPTEEMMEQLEKASTLDPENEELSQEVAYQRQRKTILAARVAEAKRVRKVVKSGGDPYADLPPMLGGQIERNTIKEGRDEK